MFPMGMGGGMSFARSKPLSYSNRSYVRVKFRDIEMYRAIHGAGLNLSKKPVANNIFQLTYIPSYGSKTQRTVVAEDASGLSTLVQSPGMTGAAMKTCFSQGSSGTFTFNWYNFVGGSSTQAWQSPASAPTALIEGGRPAVSNWPWITQTKKNA